MKYMQISNFNFKDYIERDFYYVDKTLLIEELLNTQSEEIEENVVFSKLNEPRYLWSLLLFSGYLKARHIDRKIHSLQIPNEEIKELYESMIREFFSEITKSSLSIIRYIKERDIESFKSELQNIMTNVVSYDDIKYENSIHMLILGLVYYLEKEGYKVRSNRESGLGRYDLSITPKDKSKVGYIIEFKRAYENENIEKVAEEAIKQIEDKKYYAELVEQEIKNIILLGIAFKSKKLFIKTKNL